jgi:hypothetical protein
MKRKTSRRLIRRLGLALAVFAIAAPAAQAIPDVRYPDDLHATAPHLAMAPNVTYPDDLTRPYIAEQQSEQVVTDGLGRPLPPESLVQPTIDVSSDSSGFDWTYVGIGVLAIGLMLLVGGALMIGRQNRRSRLAPA